MSIVRDSYQYLNIGSSSATKLLYTWDKSGKSELVFDFPLDNYLLSEIENIRSGGDLNLSADISLLAKTHDPSYILEEQECPFSIKFTIAKSEWNDKILPQLISKKVTLITIPIIDLPEIPLTHDLIKYLNEAHKALNDGRYGDVFGECRQSINALYNGIEQWGKSQLTDDDKNKIPNNSEKTNTLRNISFLKLVEHEEKGKRINQLRNSLYQYLSLDPHEADYKGITFTRGDAISALNITTSFVSNILYYMNVKLKKYRNNIQ